MASMSLDIARTGLIVVDAQRGFTSLCPEELPVPGGLEIVPNVNRLLAMPWLRIDASQDWHPPDHCSFIGRDGNLYPPHCVMNTPGADFLPGLDSHRFHADLAQGLSIRRRSLRRHRPAPGVRPDTACNRREDGGHLRHRHEYLLLLHRPRSAHRRLRSGDRRRCERRY